MGLLIFAADRVTDSSAQAPTGPGTGVAIIVGILVLLVLGAIVLYRLIARGSKASKGGVQPPPHETGESHPKAPPLESIEPRS